MITNSLRPEPILNTSKSTKFSMQASGKMFKMIMAGLYSKKAESITREIWSNAYDAHSMAGYPDLPFEVSLPTRFNPQFYCRDFGEGLSDEWMNLNYVVVGHSSKEDTNDAVGKWGVGRMSPTAYVDTFTVTSIHKGLKTVYNVTLSSDGSPSLNTLIPTMETDEKSGLLISFPVNPSDISEFSEAAKRVALGFDVKPKVKGFDDFKWADLDFTVSGENYKFFNNTINNRRGPHIKMGCVIYPVDTTQIKSASWANNLNILVEVPIGTADVTASREDLSYGAGEVTRDNLSKIFTDIGANLQKDTQDSIDKCSNMYDAVTMYSSSPLQLSLKRGLTYEGNPLRSPMGSVHYEQLIHGGYGSKPKLSSTHNVGNKVVEKVFFYHKGGPKAVVRAVPRVRLFAETELKRMEAMPIVAIEWDKDKKSYDYSDKEELSKVFGKHRMVDVASLADPGARNTSKRKTKVYGLDFSDREIDVTEGGIYFKSYSGNVEDLNSFGWSTPALHIVDALQKLGELKGENFVIVPKTHWKKFEGKSNWKYGPDVLKALRDKHKDELIKVSEQKTVSKDLFGLKNVKGLTGPLAHFYDGVLSQSLTYKGFDKRQCREMCRSLHISLSQDQQFAEEAKWHKIIENIYPLLKSAKDASVKEEYVLAIDMYRKSLT